MKNSLDLLKASSEEDRNILFGFIEKHKDECEFNYDSPIVDLASKAIRVDDSVVFELVMRYSFDINALTTHSASLIQVASAHGKVDPLRMLLVRNADISYHRQLNRSALSACFDTNRPLTQNHLKCVEILINAGSSIEDLKDKHTLAYQMSSYIKQKLDEVPKSLPSDKLVISIISMNIKPIKSEIERLANECDIQCIDILSNTFRQIKILDKNIHIEIPASGEKIYGHFLPEGFIIDDVPLTKPLMVRFSSELKIYVDEMTHRAVIPFSIYY